MEAQAPSITAPSLPHVPPQSAACSTKGWASFLGSARQVLPYSFIVQGTCRRDKISDSSAPTCRVLLQVDSIFVSFVRVRGAALPSFAPRRCCLFATRPSGGAASSLSDFVFSRMAQVQMEA